MINIVEYASHSPKQDIGFHFSSINIGVWSQIIIQFTIDIKRDGLRVDFPTNWIHCKVNTTINFLIAPLKLSNHIVTTRLVNLISVQAVETFKMKCASKRALVLVVIASGILIATMADAASKYFHFMFCHFD